MRAVTQPSVMVNAHAPSLGIHECLNSKSMYTTTAAATTIQDGSSPNTSSALA